MSSAKARSRLFSSSGDATQPHVSLARFKKYLKHLPLVFLAIPFYMVTYYIMVNISPATIANVLMPNTYLPFQFSLFLANFFLFSFIFLHTRRGLLLALLVQTLLFLKLQSVMMTSGLIAIILVLFGTIEICANLVTFLTSRYRKSPA